MHEIEPIEQRELIPNDHDLPEFYRGRVDDLLTHDEVTRLLNREDKGINPVSQKQYSSLQEFRRGQNNFWVFFGAYEESIMYYTNRRKKVFQRFAILNPDLATTLVNSFDQLRESGREEEELDDSIWENLYKAYQEMSALVDAADRYVARENDELDTWFLCR